MIIKKGRVCLKIAGREAGRYCVVLDEPREGFVTVAGPKSITKVRRRRCSIFHIEPTEHTIDVGGGTDMELESAWKSSGLIEKLGIKVPERRKEAKEKRPRPRKARLKKRAKKVEKGK